MVGGYFIIWKAVVMLDCHYIHTHTHTTSTEQRSDEGKKKIEKDSDGSGPVCGGDFSFYTLISRSPHRRLNRSLASSPVLFLLVSSSSSSSSSFYTFSKSKRVERCVFIDDQKKKEGM
jgi:hypothetical protein